MRRGEDLLTAITPVRLVFSHGVGDSESMASLRAVGIELVFDVLELLGGEGVGVLV